MNDTPEVLFARRPAAYCVYSDCRERASYHQMPICREHAAQAWKAFEDIEPESYKRLVRGETREIASEARALKAKVDETKRLAVHRPGTIYFVRIGDRIKIGFTTDLYRRMCQYPPNSELLAIHPGTPGLERQTHKQFAHHLADGREWFRPNRELADHIEKVRKQYPGTPTMAALREPIKVTKENSTLRPKSSRLARRV